MNIKQTVKRVACAFAAAVILPLSSAGFAVTKVACVGDSITQGWGTYTFPDQLQQLLGDNYQVENFGVSGRTLLKNGDLPYWNEQRYIDSLNFQPNIVVIQLGTNDSKPWNWAHRDQFVGNYKELINSYKNLPSRPTVYVAIASKVYDAGNFGITDEVMANEVAPRTRQAASETGSPIIDNYAATTGMRNYFPDTVHPNNEGNFAIAYNIYQSISGFPSEVEFFVDANFTGQSIAFPAGDYAAPRMSAVRFPDNAISSVKVPQGFEVEVYDSADYTQPLATYTADTPWVGGSENDVISAVKIRRTGDPQGEVFQLRSAHSDLCVEIGGWDMSDGANVIQWACHGGDNQLFRKIDAGDGYVMLENVNSGKCLEVYAWETAPGANIAQWRCHGGDNQRIKIADLGNNLVQMAFRNSGICMDVGGWSTDNGGNIIQWTCTDGANQRFYMERR